jgi:hypothetical protein
MSYDIQLFRKEVKEKYLTHNSDDFFENDENLLPFTNLQKDYLKERLLNYGYVIENETQDQISFGFEDDGGISALLTNNCLFFSSTGEGIFEINMTASEFTDTEEFEKFDPQNKGWEES